MKKNNRLVLKVLLIVGLLLSHIMCANVAFEYCNMLWGIEYAGHSAPAHVALLIAVPYLIAITIIAVAVFILMKKLKP